MSERIVCPVHGIPDCSPLLNGCSRVNELARAVTADPLTTEAREPLWTVTFDAKREPMFMDQTGGGWVPLAKYHEDLDASEQARQNAETALREIAGLDRQIDTAKAIARAALAAHPQDSAPARSRDLDYTSEASAKGNPAGAGAENIAAAASGDGQETTP